MIINYLNNYWFIKNFCRLEKKNMKAGSCMVATGSLSMQLDGLIPERDLPSRQVDP